MNFLSVEFACFYIILFTLLLFIRDLKKRNAILLLANVVFYSMGDLRSLPILIFEIIMAFFLARKIAAEKKKEGSGKAYAAAGVIITVLILASCKYLLFIGGIVFGSSFGQAHSELGMFQPIGISYYSLMVISYLVDVYRGKMEAEPDFVTVGLYISFFPHIMSGPVTKARKLMNQFKEVHPITKAGVYEGMQIFLTGALKKVLIADRLAVYTNAIYASPAEYSGLSVFFGTISFWVQLYCDFSGYTDMAVGISAIFGYKLARNFDLPFIARNPTETWKRWHMSLSSWLQEYVYFSLGGNRKGTIRQYLNLVITMVLGGLWHGAAWGYVLWGLQSGLGLCIHKLFTTWRKSLMEKPGFSFDPPMPVRKAADVLSIVLNFFFFLTGSILFRSESFADSLCIFKRIATMAAGVEYYYVYFFIYVGFIIIAFTIACIKNGGHGFYINMNLDRFGPAVLFITAILITVIFGYFGNNVFVYAQF